MITCMPMLLCAGYLKLIACSLSLSLTHSFFDFPVRRCVSSEMMFHVMFIVRCWALAFLIFVGCCWYLCPQSTRGFYLFRMRQQPSAHSLPRVLIYGLYAWILCVSLITIGVHKRKAFYETGHDMQIWDMAWWIWGIEHKIGDGGCVRLPNHGPTLKALRIHRRMQW